MYGILAQNGGVAAVILVVYLAVFVFMIASMWKVSTKSGKPGWSTFIPIYNYIVLLQIVGGQSC